MPLFIGLISGTSLDGVDAAVVEVDTDLPSFVLGHCEPYTAELRGRLERIIAAPHALDLDELGEVDRAVGEAFAGAALAVLEQAKLPAERIAAIGSHGQTVRHRPDGPLPFTMQIGDPTVIAARTAITTIADFRRADMAIGGQGAPLLPPFHAAAFSAEGEERAIVNIGGIANITRLGVDGGVTGFDTGPGNTLLDAWTRREIGAQFDRGGELAASGGVDSTLLQRLLRDAYFSRPPPKSTGREYFHLDWVDAALTGLGRTLSAADVAATLAELTAVTIAEAIVTHAPAAARIIVCGGGAHNDDLMRRLGRSLSPRPVSSSSAYGHDPDWIEATAFGWFAARRLSGRPANLPTVTGASLPAILGAVHLPPEQAGRGA